MADQQQTHEQPRGPITRHDVAQALLQLVGEAGNPHDTNAKRLRDVLGRGSMTTVQGHLDEIRAEWLRAQQPLTDADTVPSAPREAVDALWRAAWTAAHAAQLTRINTLTAERDTLRMQLAAKTEDASQMRAAAETAEATAAEAAAARDEVAGQLHGAREIATQLEAELNEVREAHATALETLRDTAAADLKAAQERAANDLHSAQQVAKIGAQEAELRLSELRLIVNSAGEREQQLRETIRQQQETIGALQGRIEDLQARQSPKGGKATGGSQ